MKHVLAVILIIIGIKAVQIKADANAFELTEGLRKVEKKLSLSKEEVKKASQLLKEKVDKDYTYYEIQTEKGTVISYAFIQNAIGKHQPITFLVKVDPDGSIQSVSVLKYRESIGGEIQNPVFLSKFKKKTLLDAFQIRKDVDGITGATLSVRATIVVSKRSLYLYNTKIKGAVS